MSLKIPTQLPYDKWSFLFPPRPENCILPSLLPYYEVMKGWLAQYKMNGTCLEIGVSPSKTLHVLTRHGSAPVRWKPTKRTEALLDFAPTNKWSVFTAELLNDKTKTIKDTIYIFDMIVAESMQLVGTTFIDRQTYLHKELFKNPVSETMSHYVMADGIWLSKPILKDFRAVFDTLQTYRTVNESVEGLVLKNPNGTLNQMFRTGSNQSWQVKCRLANEKGFRSC